MVGVNVDRVTDVVLVGPTVTVVVAGSVVGAMVGVRVLAGGSIVASRVVEKSELIVYGYTLGVKC